MREGDKFEIPVKNSSSEPSKRSVWEELKSAVIGSEADYTQIPLSRAMDNGISDWGCDSLLYLQ